MPHRRILYVIGSLAVGGAERQLAILASAIAARGVPVSVFVLEAGGPLARDLQRAGVEVIDGGYDSGAGFAAKVLRLARAQMRLVHAVLRRRPHVIHAFLPLAGLLAVVAGKITRTRAIVARRALGTHQDRFPYWRAVDRWVARNADAITANANAVAQDTARREGVPLAKIQVIPNGIDTTPFEGTRAGRSATRSQFGLSPGDVAFVCVANLIPYKGHHELIDAFARVASQRATARLFLVGADRGIGPALARRVSELGVDAQVVQLGHRDDIPAVLNAMDIAVHASHEEGMSNAVIEYLAAGLPVVATNVGGTHEILSGLTGCHLVPAQDAERLADAMLDALPELEEATGCLVRRQSAAHRFSIPAMVERHLELYGLN